MPQTISVIGGLAVDLMTVTDRLPDSGETINATSFSKSLGGKGCNSAVAAHRASRPNPANYSHDLNGETSKDEGIHVRMIGAVGKDEFGPGAIEELKSKGVDTSGFRIEEGESTGICVIVVESDFGENRILMTRGANLSLRPEEFTTLESLAGGVKPELVIAQLEIPRETIEQILETASREGVDVLLNPAPAQFLLTPVYKAITHLIVNETEAALLSGQYIEDLTNLAGWASVTDEFLLKGAKNVVVTLGAQGAYYSNTVGHGGYVEAEKDLNVVDTTGAGDTFVGTYAVDYVQQRSEGKWDIRQAVQRACKASARTICKLGAQVAIPWADEIDPPVSASEPLPLRTVEVVVVQGNNDASKVEPGTSQSTI